MQNPFKRFYDYITAKPVKQRIYIAVAIVFLLFFAFFLIKGNFFDGRDSEGTSSQITASDTSENTESTDNAAETEQSSEIHFHVSVIDFAVLIAIIAVFVVKKIREKIKNRRM